MIYSNGIPTNLPMIVSFMLRINSLYIQRKLCKNYPYNREETMIKIILTHIRNINEILIDILVGIPLYYIVYYHHDHD